MKQNRRVLIVGSAEQSGGGVTTVIRLIKKMPVWEKYSCHWLGTQIQADAKTKALYAIRAYLWALVNIWRYDIVHFHTVPNVSMKIQLPVFLLALMGRKKIIVHLHVGNQLTFPGTRNFKLAHWCMKRADRIVLLAHKFAGFMDEYWQDVKTPKTVIYNACEDVKALPYEQHEKYILYAGRFTDNKGGWLLVKAFAMIHEKFPEWKLLLLGEGEERYIYDRLVAENHLEDKVSMPGFKHGEELAAAFRKASIFGLTSHYEGFPMVVLEAWAYGVPVVTTPVGGLPDVLEEDRNACVFDYDNAEALAQKLEHLMGDDKLRADMSEFSKQFCERMFSAKAVNESLDELYEGLTVNV